MALTTEDRRRGYVKDWRCKLDWPWFTRPRTAHLFEWCLLRANWRPVKVQHAGHVVDLQPGQFITGLRVAAAETGLSIKQIRTARKHLESENAVKWAEHRAHLFSVVTVVNWGDYQSGEDAEGRPKGTAGAQQGHSRGTAGATEKKYKKKEEGE